MRLESALYASREGLNAHGQAIAVIGDNISNANTVAFKESRAEFGDIFSDGSDAHQSTTLAGGNGVEVTQVRQLQTNGIIEQTGRSLDVGIEGNGFFITAADATKPTEAQSYTRAGNFSMAENGTLVDQSGRAVLGLANGATTLSALNLLNVSATGKATSAATLFGNLASNTATTTAPTAPATFKEINNAASYTNALTVYDSQGNPHNVTIALYKTEPNKWTAQAFVDSGEVSTTAGAPVLVGSATLTFDATGVIVDANKAAAKMTASPKYSNGAAAGNFTIDLSSFTQYAGTSQVNGVTQDGSGAGNIKDYEFGKDGKLYANLDSGTQVLIGTVQLANFANPDGLVRVGKGGYVQGLDSGAPVLGTPGVTNFGTLQGGALERSTVDIANQFVNLVLIQRGYQANSQTLNATNTLLHDTIGLIR